MRMEAFMILLAFHMVLGAVPFCKAQDPKSLEARVRALEDREQIRQLMMDYGRTLDKRDFAAFAQLFAKDAEYGGGAAVGGMTQGPEAIAKLLEDVFKKNPTNVNTPNFHIFSNDTIQVNGNTATAISKGAFVVRSGGNQPESVMLATYNDTFIRENGIWKFKQRIVKSDIP